MKALDLLHRAMRAV
jgi:hypothetical protein